MLQNSCVSSNQQCPTLQNKPKLFFIEACRGHQQNHSLTASGTVPSSSGSQMVSVSALSRTAYPQEADFLLAFSTATGHVAQQTRRTGSLFVQVSCSE